MTATFEPVLLPNESKRQLCMALLEEFGADRITDQAHNKELWVRCVLPWHDQGHATASLNYSKLVYSCLAGETRVKTYDGEFEIRDLSGAYHLLLDGGGKWVKSLVREYGTQRLYRVTLTRNGVEREVYATADHRWLTRMKGAYYKGKGVDLVEKTTATLRPKDRVPSIWPMLRVGRTTISPVGVMAGFVFGDGTRTEHGSHANFYGAKDQAMLKFFSGYQVNDSQTRDRKQVVSGLPRSWKDLPSLDEGPSYLYGWLSGYFAADGCVSENGDVRLNCADRSVLEFVSTVCDRLGLDTYNLGVQNRLGVGTEPSDLYNLTFRASVMEPEFFQIPHHRDHFEQGLTRRKYERTHWWVRKVEETDRVETVYCAEVPTTHSFVLGGNVLTGNCFSCGSGMGLLALIKTCRGIDEFRAHDWVMSSTGLGGSDFDLAAAHAILDALEAPEAPPEPMPYMSPRILAPWQKVVHPYLTEPRSASGRGIPYQNVVDLGIGYADQYPLGKGADGRDRYSKRIVIPHYFKGKLVGWMTRRLFDDGTPKYLNSGGLPRDRTIHGYDPDREVAVLVEAPISRARHYHHLPMESTMGDMVTERQRWLLAHHKVVVCWPDPDEEAWGQLLGHDVEEWHRGETRIRHVPGLIELMEPYVEFRVVPSDWSVDPADLDDDALAEEMVAASVPGALWAPPSRLRCWECKEYHEGECAS